MKKMFIKLFVKNYAYVVEYKHYYKRNKPYYDSIKYTVFFMETLLNLVYCWNKAITKNNSKSKLFINTDNLFFDIEKYF